jgi:formylglycine-generating enzyme required for sulfatase activity
MTENQNQPREYDAVLGGESQVPMAAAVLGGIPGVKSRLASPIVEVRIAALSEALKYRDAGLDLIIGALQDESMAVRVAAYWLLKDRDEPNLKQQFQKYLPTFEFDVITVNPQGEENSRLRHYAHFFPEDLGNGSVLEMVYIPGGTFMMGCPATGRYRRDNESPQHQVTVPAFFAGKYSITRGQWKALMGPDLDPWRLRYQKLPVHVSWDEVVEFCDRLSQKTGKKYRLLSEAEWEYACRAGTTTPFHFGETITPELVRYRRHTTYVGGCLPNAFGLYDLHGQVWEWCSDRWHENYNGAPTDGSSWETGTSEYRMQRGGSLHSPAFSCRSAYRVRDSTGNRQYYIGFRVALVFGSML